jgi:hypothetical protein
VEGWHEGARGNYDLSTGLVRLTNLEEYLLSRQLGDGDGSAGARDLSGAPGPVVPDAAGTHSGSGPRGAFWAAEPVAGRVISFCDGSGFRTTSGLKIEGAGMDRG